LKVLKVAQNCRGLPKNQFSANLKISLFSWLHFKPQFYKIGIEALHLALHHPTNHSGKYIKTLSSNRNFLFHILVMSKIYPTPSRLPSRDYDKNIMGNRIGQFILRNTDTHIRRSLPSLEDLEITCFQLPGTFPEVAFMNGLLIDLLITLTANKGTNTMKNLERLAEETKKLGIDEVKAEHVKQMASVSTSSLNY